SSAYMIENPGVVKAMVTSSPMYEIDLKMPEELALFLAEGAVDTGFGEWYVFGRGPDDWKVPFAKNSLTNSEPRYNYFQSIREEDDSLVIAGATNQWVREAILLSQYVRQNAEKLVDPVLVLEGTADKVVQPGAEEEFVKNAPHARLHRF